MSIIRSERYSAIFLIVAAAAGFGIAALLPPPAWDALHDFLHYQKIGGIISPYHLVTDLLLAVFFFAVAVELKHELVVGELNDFRKAIVPAIAALGGVIVPAAVYLSFTAGGDYTAGWPIPTATDIAFALGVLAIFGKGLPAQVRVFLLALAVLDDLIAILIIAVVLTSAIGVAQLLGAITTTVLFAVCSYVYGNRSRQERRCAAGRRVSLLLIVLMMVLALATWALTYFSGVHATIAGVALGLVMNRRQAARTEHVLQPGINGFVLPVFALLAAMVRLPGLDSLTSAFWGVLVALPVGKLIGIMLFGVLAVKIFGGRSLRKSLPPINIAIVGMLGGIGFTVSLLMNELAFGPEHELAQNEGTVAVLLGSLISMVAAVILIRIRLRHYRRKQQPHEAKTARITAGG